MESRKEDHYSAETSRVGVRPPPFWPDDPEMWFAQMECQFALANVTVDLTKYYQVVSALEPRYATEVKDIITNPPATNKFEKIKTELIKRLTASRQRRIKQLITHEELGDRKPSQFLRRLRDLAGPAVPEDFLKSLWSGRLPTNLQTVLASQPDLSLDKLADLADTVNEIAPCGPLQVASVADPSTSTLIKQMASQISELTKQVTSLSTQVNKQRQVRGRSYSRSSSGSWRGRSRSRPRQPPENHPHCWYHFSFGPRARKCTQPCSWQAENAKGSRN